MDIKQFKQDYPAVLSRTVEQLSLIRNVVASGRRLAQAERTLDRWRSAAQGLVLFAGFFTVLMLAAAIEAFTSVENSDVLLYSVCGATSAAIVAFCVWRLYEGFQEYEWERHVYPDCLADFCDGVAKLETTLPLAHLVKPFVALSALMHNPQPFEELAVQTSGKWKDLHVRQDRLNRTRALNFLTYVLNDISPYADSETRRTKLDTLSGGALPSA